MQRRTTLGDGFLLGAEVRSRVEERMNKVGSERNNMSHSMQSC